MIPAYFQVPDRQLKLTFEYMDKKLMNVRLHLMVKLFVIMGYFLNSQLFPASKSPLNTRRIVPVGVIITGSLNIDCGLIF